jgi:transketolase
VDGHDHAALLATYRDVPFETGRPSCLIARTHKGQGVSFMVDEAAWHHRVPDADQLQAALVELGETA